MKDLTLFLPSLTIFFGVTISCLWLFEAKVNIKLQKKSVLVKAISQKNYDLKKVLIIISLAVIGAIFTHTLTKEVWISLLFYLILLVLLSYLFYANHRRRQHEEVFRNIILYCHNMSMLLSETRNVHHALSIVVNDIDVPLKNDVMILIDSLTTSRLEMEEVLNAFSKKYAYSIIDHLNVIITHMHYENDKIDQEVLVTFYDDINQLNKELYENMLKRKTLRFQYFMISIGSVLAYWFLYQQLTDVFTSYGSKSNMTMINSIYLILTLVVMIIVDNYFNSNITKE
jgi:Ca2+/Na+ antiporter